MEVASAAVCGMLPGHAGERAESKEREPSDERVRAVVVFSAAMIAVRPSVDVVAAGAAVMAKALFFAFVVLFPVALIIGALTWRTTRPSSLATGGTDMNWDRIAGNWKQIRGQLKRRWGELTDDELDRIDGRKDEMIGLLQERYGMVRERAQREIEEFCATCTR